MREQMRTQSGRSLINILTPHLWPHMHTYLAKQKRTYVGDIRKPGTLKPSLGERRQGANVLLWNWHHARRSLMVCVQKYLPTLWVSQKGMKVLSTCDWKRLGTHGCQASRLSETEVAVVEMTLEWRHQRPWLCILKHKSKSGLQPAL